MKLPPNIWILVLIMPWCRELGSPFKIQNVLYLYAEIAKVLIIWIVESYNTVTVYEVKTIVTHPTMYLSFVVAGLVWEFKRSW
jgi:hypothetical protein